MVQTIETSHQEKVEMYRMIEKERLIEMLIEANNHLSRLCQPIGFSVNDEYWVGVIKYLNNKR